jgi:HPt (histidine-containing phosphotransfer) domain-containing protein
MLQFAPSRLQGIDWMPSPPLVPDDTPLDIAHLDRATGGQVDLVRELLALFSAQAAQLMPLLAAGSPDTAILAHRLLGSAKAIGAHRVADAAEALEADPRDRDALASLSHAVDAVLEVIDRRLQRC